MKIKKQCGIVFLCLVLLQSTPVYAQESEPGIREGDLYARAAVLMDADSGRILYGKNSREALPNASTTKILTCILALEHCDPENTMVSVSANAASQPKVHLGMRVGEEYRMIDLLYGLMLESFNDCAVAIAESISGDVLSFAKLMNEKALEIGCRDSYFITPNGLDGEDAISFHHSTAEDLARIMRYCITKSPAAEAFLKITQTNSYEFTSGERSFSCSNHNALLSMVEGAISGKTGFTGAAGYCYTGAVRSEERTFVVALLGCGWYPHKSLKWKDVRTLLAYGEQKYAFLELGSGFDIPDSIEAKNARTDNVPIETDAKPVTILAGASENVTRTYEIFRSIQAPAPAGTIVGEVTDRIDEKIIAVYPVRTTEEVVQEDFWHFFVSRGFSCKSAK